MTLEDLRKWLKEQRSDYYRVGSFDSGEHYAKVLRKLDELDAGPERTILGFKVVLDETLSPNVIQLRAPDGTVKYQIDVETAEQKYAGGR